MTLLSILISITPSPEGYDATELLALDSEHSLSEPQVVDLSLCVAGQGLLPGDCFFAVWKRPWVLIGESINGWSDQELRDTVYSNVEALKSHFPAGPVLSFTQNEKIVTRAHLAYWAAFDLECDPCYTIRPLEVWERDIVAKQAGLLGIQGEYTHSITSQDLWRDTSLSLSGSMVGLDRRGYPRASAFLSPGMLGYVWAPDRNMLLVARLDRKPSESEPVPSWVYDALAHNPAFVCRAKAIVAKSGLTWKGWMETHGYVPGDRTPLDMQYTYQLRWATRPYLIDTWTGLNGKMLYDLPVAKEEKRRHLEEEQLAHGLVNTYIGGCK